MVTKSCGMHIFAASISRDRTGATGEQSVLLEDIWLLQVVDCDAVQVMHPFGTPAREMDAESGPSVAKTCWRGSYCALLCKNTSLPEGRRRKPHGLPRLSFHSLLNGQQGKGLARRVVGLWRIRLDHRE